MAIDPLWDAHFSVISIFQLIKLYYSITSRYTVDNIRLLFNIVDYTKFKQLPGAALFNDFFKEFDP